MSRRRIPFLAAAFAAAGAMLVSQCLTPVQAAGRLYGVDQIVENMKDSKEDFRILEIVPDYSYASMGYFGDGRDVLVDSRYLAECTSAQDREKLVKELLAGVSKEDRTVSLKSYEEQLYPGKESEGWRLLDLSENQGYTETRTGRFVKASELGLSSGNYYISRKMQLELTATVTAGDGTPGNPDTVTLRLAVQTGRLDVDETATIPAHITLSDNGTNDLNRTGLDVDLNHLDGSLYEFTYPLSEEDRKNGVTFRAEGTTTGQDSYLSDQVKVTYPDYHVETGSVKVETDGNLTVQQALSEDETVVTVYLRGPEEPSQDITIEVNSTTSTLSASLFKKNAGGEYEASFDYPTSTKSVNEIILNGTSIPGNTGTIPAKVYGLQPTEVIKAGDPKVSSTQAEAPVNWEDYSYSETVGSYVWVDGPQGETGNVTIQVPVEKLWYRVTAGTGDVFGRYVLELNSAAADNDEAALLGRIRVLTYTPNDLEEALRSNTISLSQMNLVYLSDNRLLPQLTGAKTYMDRDSDGAYTNDLTWETVQNIVSFATGSQLPVVVDKSVLSLGGADEMKSTTVQADGKTTVIPGSNVLRLAYLLRNATAEGETVMDLNLVEEDWTPGRAQSVANAEFGTWGLYGKIRRNIFLNDGDTLARSSIDDTIFTYQTGNNQNGETVLAGMDLVVGEILDDNFYNDTPADYTTEYSVANGKETVTVTQATLLKYILNIGLHRVTLQKDRLRILDLEPTRYSTLSEDTIRQWLGAQEGSDSAIREIQITQMSTYEFIASLEDLVEKYDMIYIGSCIGPNGALGSLYQQNGSPVYNDTSLNGKIYLHVGDTVSGGNDSTLGMMGLLNSEVDRMKQKQYNQYATVEFVTRYSGNDLTRDKYNELLHYMQSGYPIVVDSKLYNSYNNVPSAQTVDDTSYMYRLMQSGSSQGDSMGNLMTSDQASGRLLRYINLPRLDLVMTSVPTPFESRTDANGKLQYMSWLEPKGNTYYLEYEFEFSNTAESSGSTTRYGASLFIDVNADGRYAATEELDALSVKDVRTGKAVAWNRLEAGVRYRLTRELPQQYVGMLPWKLVITRNSDGSSLVVKTSANGYTAVRSEGNPVTIKVLQILPMDPKNDDDGVKNLMPYTASDGTRYEGAGHYPELIRDMNKFMNYDLQVECKTVADIEKEYQKYGSSDKFYREYLKNFDMLLWGYADGYGYKDFSNGVINAFAQFIDSGKATLFSHDLTSYNNGYFEYGSKYSAAKKETEWGYHMNQYLRSKAGMDRFGITETSLAKLKDENAYINVKAADIEAAGKDVASAPGTAAGSDVKAGADGKRYYLAQGYTNGISEVNKWGNDQFHVVTEDTSANFLIKDQKYTRSVSQNNEGQITVFPYDISATETKNDQEVTGWREKVSGNSNYYVEETAQIEVGRTHYQYYQLDFNYDTDGDGTNNLVVWYSLAGGIYDHTPNDARNNYYIYSVGNITYTGMGHGPRDGENAPTLKEEQLFINTMVAAYQAGIRNPSLNIISGEENKGETLDQLYRTFDEGVAVDNNSDETFAFYVNDLNIIDGSKEIQVSYYKTVSKETYDKAVSAAGSVAGANANGYFMTTDKQGQTVWLKAYTDAEAAEVLKEVPKKVDSGEIRSLTLKASWLNSKLADSGSVSFWIGARTRLIHDGTNREDDYTGYVFSEVTIKRRSLIQLD